MGTRCSGGSECIFNDKLYLPQTSTTIMLVAGGAAEALLHRIEIVIIQSI